MIELYIKDNTITIKESWNGINVLVENPLGNISINNIPQEEARRILLQYISK